MVVNYVTQPETAEAVVSEIEAMGRKAIALKAEVTNEDEVEFGSWNEKNDVSEDGFIPKC